MRSSLPPGTGQVIMEPAQSKYHLRYEHNNLLVLSLDLYIVYVACYQLSVIKLI